MANFPASRKRWIYLAVFTEIVLFLSFTSTARGDPNPFLQFGGMALLVILLVMFIKLCRCNSCRKLLIDKQKFAVGWGYKVCPHCGKELS